MKVIDFRPHLYAPILKVYQEILETVSGMRLKRIQCQRQNAVTSVKMRMQISPRWRQNTARTI